MAGLNRRDALLAGGAVMAGTLLSSDAQAADEKKGKKGAAGLEFSKEQLSLMQKANTPEEFAQAFMRTASGLLAQSLADALSQTINTAYNTEKGQSIGNEWVQYVLNSQVEWGWTTPPGLTPGHVTVLAQAGPPANASAEAKALGWDVGLTIRGSF